MPDYKNELEAIKSYYAGDKLQKRFSALITGETNAGKSFILRTARLPIHIDSFDPGGTKCLTHDPKNPKSNKYACLCTPDNPEGQIIADTQWEDDDPFNPDKFDKWMKAIERRFLLKYFDNFGTYVIDSATTWGDAVMRFGMKKKNKAGEVPNMRHDYMPQKIHMENYIKKLMRIPCDFIVTGHLREIKKLIRIDSKTGISTEEIKYRFYTTGQALITIPLLFDEIYVIVGKEGRDGPKREMLVDSLGTYVARSRLKGNGKLSAIEPPDIKAILKKCGFDSKDKAKLGGE